MYVRGSKVVFFIVNDFAFFILKIFTATKAIHSNDHLKRGKREHCKVSPSML